MVASAQSARSLFLRRVRQSRVGAVLASASLPRALAARDPRLGTADLLSEFLLSGAPPRRLRRLAPPGAGGEAVQSSLVGLLSAVSCQMSDVSLFAFGSRWRRCAPRVPSRRAHGSSSRRCFFLFAAFFVRRSGAPAAWRKPASAPRPPPRLEKNSDFIHEMWCFLSDFVEKG